MVLLFSSLYICLLYLSIDHTDINMDKFIPAVYLLMACDNNTGKSSINPIIWGFTILAHFSTLTWHSALKEYSPSEGEGSFLQPVKISGVVSTSVSACRAGN